MNAQREILDLLATRLIEDIMVAEDLRILDSFYINDDPAMRLRARIDHLFSLRGNLIADRVDRRCSPHL